MVLHGDTHCLHTDSIAMFDGLIPITEADANKKNKTTRISDDGRLLRQLRLVHVRSQT